MTVRRSGLKPATLRRWQTCLKKRQTRSLRREQDLSLLAPARGSMLASQTAAKTSSLARSVDSAKRHSVASDELAELSDASPGKRGRRLQGEPQRKEQLASVQKSERERSARTHISAESGLKSAKRKLLLNKQRRRKIRRSKTEAAEETAEGAEIRVKAAELRHKPQIKTPQIKTDTILVQIRTRMR